MNSMKMENYLNKILTHIEASRFVLEEQSMSTILAVIPMNGVSTPRL